MKVLLFSRYERNGASSRVRSYQYLPFLRKFGIEVTSQPFFSADYLTYLYQNRKIPLKIIVQAYWNRIKNLLKCSDYDAVWIEKELFPWLPAVFEITLKKKRIPLVFDYDDAIFHRYDHHPHMMVRCLLGNKTKSIARCANLVIGGNDYLCEHFIEAGAKWVELLPSVINLERYFPAAPTKWPGPFTIGWIGSPTTTNYLYGVADVLREFLKETDSRLLLVGSSEFTFPDLPVEIRKWNENQEVQDIQEFDVGIMPLDTSRWSEGKCGYKLIQYMACAKPVIAAYTRANADIVQNGQSGFLVHGSRDWIAALWQLYSNTPLRKKMGAHGRQIVEDKFCVQKTSVVLAEYFRRLQSQRDNKVH